MRVVFIPVTIGDMMGRLPNDPIIAIDVDDVALNLVEAWLKLYNFLYNDNLNPQDIKSFDIASYTKCKKPEDFFKLYGDELYDVVNPMEGALEGINKIRKFSRVIFVTSNTNGGGEGKFNCLNRHGFEVKKEDFIQAVDKSLIRCNLLFDDYEKNVKKAFRKGVFFTRPWNVDIYHRYRVDNWKALAKFAKTETSKEE